MAESRGIVILGTPRSGTTLLRRILDAHPSIACPGETNLLTACARFLHQEPISGGVEVGVLTGLSYAGFHDAEVMNRLRDFAFGFLEEFAARQGKRRWAEKTAFNTFYLNEIDRLCDTDVQYVCIVRHGLDVACSIRELCDRNERYFEELHRYIAQNPCPIEAFATLWVDLTTALLRFVERHDKNAVCIRYEDLILTPEETLEEVFDFLGEPWDRKSLKRNCLDGKNIGLGDWKTYAHVAFDAGSIGRWKELSSDLIFRASRVVNPLLTQCGYEAVGEQDAVDPIAARRKYELALTMRAASAERPLKRKTKTDTE